MKKIIKKIIRMCRIICTRISPVMSNKIMYKKLVGKKLNLKEPRTFNEKINYLKIYEFPKDEKVITCADKYKVREYIKNKGLGDILVELIDAWDNAYDIDFEKLPQKFVLKCNHGCGYNIICKNKDKLDKNNTIKRINKWMNEDFGLVSGEYHYSKIPRKIICEKFLEDDIKDYKFFCFKGVPKFFYVSQNIDGDFHNMQADFFYPDGSKADFERTDHKHFEKEVELPKNLNDMIEISRKLSSEFEFVRVDLFCVGDKIYFSELTFTPCSGFMPIKPENKDVEFGKLIDL